MKDQTTGFLSQERLARFRERVAASLEQRPQELPVEAHRQRIADLLARLGDRNLFDLLGVGPAAEEAEVHRAYTELARLVHPDHAAALSLEGREPALELLFERATEAYLTLSDPELKARYRQRLEAAGWRVDAVSDEARAEEKKREARRQYRIASHLATDERFHEAVQLLEQVVALDPQAPYLALLGRCLAKNPHWIQEAVDRYVEAAALEPTVGEYRRELGLLFERVGNAAGARKQLRLALDLDPTDVVAREGLERLQSALAAHRPDRPPPWRRLLQWLRPSRRDRR